MSRDFREALLLMIAAFVMLFLLFFAIVLSGVWLKGHAKSNWLKNQRGIEIPWYEAASIEIRVDDCCKTDAKSE